MPFNFRVLGLLERPEKLPINVLLSFMRKARHVSAEYADLGDTLVAGAGQYLSAHSLRALVREELPDDIAREEINENKKLYRRIGLLLPAISDLFSPPNPDNLFGFTSAVLDCCDEYRASLRSARKDRKERETLKVLADASAILKDAIDLVGTVERFVSLSYEDFHELFFSPDRAALPHFERLKQRSNSDVRQTIDVLLHEMDLCRATLEIVLVSARREPDQLLLSGSDGKTTIVHNAYDMSLMWNGPRISTTPGSNFSALCSLLFECASGNVDESLAGAINRYARSQQRLKLEEAEREYRQEEALSDNFDEQRNTIRRSRETITECKSLLDLPDLDQLARTLLSLRLKRAESEAETATLTYGPRQYYVNEFTPAQLADLGADKLNLSMLAKMDIALGDLRRSAKARKE